MGIMHAVYGECHILSTGRVQHSTCAGLGAFCSPLISTQFAERRHWSFHYLTSLGVAAINLIAQCAVLRFRTQEGGLVLACTRVLKSVVA